MELIEKWLERLGLRQYGPAFVQADIDQLSLDRTKLDDAILKEDLGIPFAIFNRYEQRAVERFAYARTLLKQGFDFHG